MLLLVGQKIQKLPLFDDLKNIEFFPPVFVVEAVVPFLAQFDTDLVRLDPLNRLRDLEPACLADVRRADDVIGAFAVLNRRDMGFLSFPIGFV